MHLHAPPFLALGGSALAAVLLGLLLTPLFRLSGAYFSIANLAAALAVLQVVSNPALEDITKGPYGVSLSRRVQSGLAYGVALAILAATLLLVIYLQQLALRHGAAGDPRGFRSAPPWPASTWCASASSPGCSRRSSPGSSAASSPGTSRCSTPRRYSAPSFSIFAIVFALFGGTATIARADPRRRHPLRHLQLHRHLDAAIFPAHLRPPDHGAGAVPAERPGLAAAPLGDRCPLKRSARRSSRSRLWSSASVASARSTA